MLGAPGTRRGSDDRGFRVLSHSQNCQIWPLPRAWGRPAPAPAGRPRTDHPCAAGTRVHGARAAVSGSRRVYRHHRTWPLTRLNERIVTGKPGAGWGWGGKNFFANIVHRVPGRRDRSPPSRGPLGRALPADNWNSVYGGPTSFVLTNFWLFLSRTIHSPLQSPWW